ncbi:MAG: ROK family protein [Pseudonocardiaceae bacterium]
MDVGGTKVALRLEGSGRKSYDTSFGWNSTKNRRSQGPADDLAMLADKVRELRGCWQEPIQAVGVAMPATLDGSGRVLAWPGRPGWVGVELWTLLCTLFPDTEVRCADDGDLAAVAEAREVGCADLVYIGVGTGIGGGIVSGGRSFPGRTRGSCEIGHVVIDRCGAGCDCGRRGCLQAVASGPATLRRAAELRGNDVTFAELRCAVLAGQSWAVSAVEDSAAALAAAVISVSELLHPSLVLIGGGFAAQLPCLVQAVSAEVARLARPGSPPPPVQVAVLGGLSSLYGAVLAARGLAG